MMTFDGIRSADPAELMMMNWSYCLMKFAFDVQFGATHADAKRKVCHQCYAIHGRLRYAQTQTQTQRKSFNIENAKFIIYI